MSNGIKIEIKTARKGLNNDTFQFNGINPIYNYDFIILIGITESSIFYRIIDRKSSIKYIHSERVYKFCFNADGKIKNKQLVKMNPDNTVNYKLTLSIKELYSIENFSEKISNLLKD